MCSPEAFLPVYPTGPCPSPTLALVQPPHAQGGSGRYTLGDPRLHASTVSMDSPVILSASICIPVLPDADSLRCGPGTLVLCLQNLCVQGGTTLCSWPPHFPPQQQQIHLLKKWRVTLWLLGATGCARMGFAAHPKGALPAPRAVNLLLQMANFENLLIRIRSSTSIFIYFSFS